MKSRLTLALGLALAAALASAVSPVGTWTGKVTMMKTPTIPPGATPQQKAMMQQAMSMASKIRLVLTLKADKTFSYTVMGMATAQKQPPHTGTWSQKGNTVTTTSKEMAGRPQDFTLSPDGKTMTLTIPNGQGKVVFTR